MTKSGLAGRQYYPNLDGLRAFGALIVLMSHVDLMRIYWGFPSQGWFPIPGKIGVSLFFSLSGFLITSLLWKELEKTKTISLKNFYIRRMLRIWPLYYFMILLCIFVINKLDYFSNTAQSAQLYDNLTWLNILNLALILPNFTHFIIPYYHQRWSIAVEELFYFFQPGLVKIFRKRLRLFFVFVGIIFSSEIIVLLFKGTGLSNHVSNNFIDSCREQLKYLGCIAVGCLGSLPFYDREKWYIKFLFSRPFQIFILVLILFLVGFSYYILHEEEFLDFRLYCLLFTIVVVNAALNPDTIYRLEHPILKFLGKISYGIYMYHVIGIRIGICTAQYFKNIPALEVFITYTVTLGVTILIAWLSFQYFESFFLRLKPKNKSLTGSKKTENKNIVPEISSPQ